MAKKGDWQIKAAELATKAEELRDEIEALQDDMQQEFDSHGERWQEGDKGQAVSEHIEILENIKDEAANVHDALGGMVW